MPIFSNRSIDRMLRHIAPVIGARRERDLLRRLDIGEDAAVSAEWEIGAIYCLAQQGEIQGPESRDKTREPDLIYTSRMTGGHAAVEITAISDASLHERNPVEAFNTELHRIIRKEKLYLLGGIHAQIGNTDSRE